MCNHKNSGVEISGDEGSNAYVTCLKRVYVNKAGHIIKEYTELVIEAWCLRCGAIKVNNKWINPPVDSYFKKDVRK